MPPASPTSRRQRPRSRSPTGTSSCSSGSWRTTTSRPTAIVRLVTSSLHPKTVLVVDDREVYSTNLTQGIVKDLAKRPRHLDQRLRRRRAAGLRRCRRQDRPVDQRRRDAVRQSAMTRSGSSIKSTPPARIRPSSAATPCSRSTTSTCRVPTSPPTPRRIEDAGRSRDRQALQRDIRRPGSIRRNRVRRDGDRRHRRARLVPQRQATRDGSRQGPPRRPDPVHAARELRGFRCPPRAHRSRYWMYRIEGGSYTQAP